MKKKIGIFLPGLHGDIMTATSALKYKHVLWSDTDIIWFCNEPHSDAFKFNNDIAEIRQSNWEELSSLKDDNTNKILQHKKYDFQYTQDLDEGYFPAPWMVSTLEQRHGIDYPNFHVAYLALIHLGNGIRVCIFHKKNRIWSKIYVISCHIQKQL